MKIKKIYLMFMLLSLLSCGSGLTDMFDDMGRDVPVCVDGVNGSDTNDGRGWGNAYKTIQQAINAETTEAGAEIWVKQSGDYILTATLTVDKPVAIYGGFTGSEWTRSGRDLDNKTVITGGANFINITAAGVNLDGFEFTGFSSSLMNIIEGPVTISNCEVINNVHSSDAIMFDLNGNSLNVNSCVFSGNTFSSSGDSHIFSAGAGSSLTITNSTFTNNSTAASGTVVNASGSTVTLTGCTFTTNTAANDGGAIYLNSGAGTLTATGCTFSGSEATSGSGGAIFSGPGNSITLSDSDFSDNTADSGIGGAIYAEKTGGDNSNLSINSGCTFTGNSAKSGGAIYLQIGNTADSINIENCIFTENSALPNNSTQGGGAIFAVIMGGASTCSLNLTSCDFGTDAVDASGNKVPDGNKAPNGSGGAIFLSSVTLNANRCNFYGNTSNYGLGAGGGAVYANISGFVLFNVNLTDCVYKGNSAGNSGSGGACLIKNCEALTITGSTFGNSEVPDDEDNKNTASSNGGALYIQETVTDITNSFFYGNVSDTHGGAIFVSNGSQMCTMNNTIFDGNKATAANGYGGGIFAYSSLTFDGCTIEDNSANRGGGVYSEDSSAPLNSLTITNCTITDNTATGVNNWGGGIRAYNLSSLSLINTVLTLNNAGSGGGANFEDINNLTIRGCSFGEKGNSNVNTAVGYGGALFVAASDTVIDRTAFYGNSSSLLGGAIFFQQNSEAFTIANSLFCSNKATGSSGYGGGIYVITGVTSNKILNTTFYDNRSGGECASIFLDGGIIDIYNSVFWNNTSNNFPDLGVNLGSDEFNFYYCAFNDDINNGTSGDNIDQVSVTGSPFVSTTSTSLNFLYPADDILNEGDSNPSSYLSAYMLDLAGNSRITTGGSGSVARVDVGCYERQN
ncbi:MAG: hypothetical protein CVV49_16355 [Spirochaetae bacterium HGW-Spirochaetae-5]|nr:MAG: hypothetical protein CVV49_16355 [Spirochaetae bacterium HGW-Spirochaetae-5]